MCRPYEKEANYYYPGRPAMTSFFLVPVFIIPFIINPSSIDCWLLLKTFFLPVSILWMTILLLSYFGRVMQAERWHAPLIIAGIPITLTFLAMFIAAVVPGDQLTNPVYINTVKGVNYIIGAFATVVCIISSVKVIIWSKGFDDEDFSNPMDFPVFFSRRTVLMIIFVLFFLWCAAIIDNKSAMCIVELATTITTVILLIFSLHPNRHREMTEEQAEPKVESSSPLYMHVLALKRHGEELATIRRVVEKEKAYLEPHLTIQDVANKCGFERAQTAEIIKEEFGSFFKYINTLRLEYADAYMQAHPNASISEIADNSGFGTRQTYYNVKLKLQKLSSSNTPIGTSFNTESSSSSLKADKDLL